MRDMNDFMQAPLLSCITVILVLVCVFVFFAALDAGENRKELSKACEAKGNNVWLYWDERAGEYTCVYLKDRQRVPLNERQDQDIP